jgi:(S)-2-hydroxyglutarate dehydrogenase
MAAPEHDVVVVGAGIVGLSTALALLRARPSLAVAVVDAEDRVAAHQSSHNSGVVHAGVYYEPGSLKARLCREGRRELIAFASERGIPYRQDGKVIVAVRRSEHARLDALHARAVQNGLEGVDLIGGAELRELEPHAAGERALRVPETGVIDFAAVSAALADAVAELGGTVRLGWPVTGLTRTGDGWRLESRGTGPGAAPTGAEAPGAGRGSESRDGVLRARGVIACAGLGGDRLLRLSGGDDGAHRIVPFRGGYRTVLAEGLVRSMIYPVPDPRLPFLGVHFTRGIDDHVHVGPNAVLATGRGTRAALRYPGLRRLLLAHARAGIAELWRDNVAPAFLRSARRYLPELTAADLAPGGSGIRAQCVARDGSLVHDFLVREDDGIIHVRNAPSPAATASPAIGRLIAERAIERFGLR